MTAYHSFVLSSLKRNYCIKINYDSAPFKTRSKDEW